MTVADWLPFISNAPDCTQAQDIDFIYITPSHLQSQTTTMVRKQQTLIIPCTNTTEVFQTAMDTLMASRWIYPNGRNHDR